LVAWEKPFYKRGRKRYNSVPYRIYPWCGGFKKGKSREGKSLDGHVLTLRFLVGDGMGEMEEKIKELRERKEKIKQAGRAEPLTEVISKGGMLGARERIEALMDKSSFVEMDMLATHHCTFFGMDKKEIPADGVITGYGKIDGRLVFAYSQDFSALRGTYGEMHGRKICKILDKAAQIGAPVVGMCHSGGLRLHEVLGPMEMFGQLFYRNSVYSGVIPQISLVMGTVAGGQAYSPGLTDFIIMTEGSFIYVAGPAFVRTQIGEETTEGELGGAAMHSEVSGVADLVAKDEMDCFKKTRQLLSYLPSNNTSLPPVIDSRDKVERREPKLNTFVPVNSKIPFDMKEVIRLVIDNEEFFEVKPQYAQNMITGFGRLNGRPVGIVASQPLVLAGVIDVKAAEKAARFVRFCDCFNIPIVTLQDTPGYMIGTREEKKGMIFRGAKLLYAYAEATVPKVTVIVRKAYAGAYIAMGSKYIGADQVFAWPIAEIASVAPETAASIIFKKEIEEASNPDEVREERLGEYYEKFINPYNAASRQDIDDVIEPSETRPALIRALDLLASKKEEKPWRKHGNIPL
jgi:acetyl-CoA carboxylase carboxyltransferase component